MDKPVSYPICPFCKAVLTPTKYQDYQLGFTYWGCDCELDQYVEDKDCWGEYYD